MSSIITAILVGSGIGLYCLSRVLSKAFAGMEDKPPEMTSWEKFSVLMKENGREDLLKKCGDYSHDDGTDIVDLMEKENVPLDLYITFPIRQGLPCMNFFFFDKKGRFLKWFEEVEEIWIKESGDVSLCAIVLGGFFGPHWIKVIDMRDNLETLFSHEVIDGFDGYAFPLKNGSESDPTVIELSLEHDNGKCENKVLRFNPVTKSYEDGKTGGDTVQ